MTARIRVIDAGSDGFWLRTFSSTSPQSREIFCRSTSFAIPRKHHPNS
jgi:hypothetical protein